MVKSILNILEETLKYDGDYKELAEYLYIIITTDNDREYNQVIDEIQLLILRKAFIFKTFMECEEIYRNIKESVGECAK